MAMAVDAIDDLEDLALRAALPMRKNSENWDLPIKDTVKDWIIKLSRWGYIYIHTCICLCLCICICVCICVCVCVCVCVCMIVCMYVCIYVYIYISTNTTGGLFKPSCMADLTRNPRGVTAFSWACDSCMDIQGGFSAK